jgi:uncharacterized delta-60 repeat protein
MKTDTNCAGRDQARDSRRREGTRHPIASVTLAEGKSDSRRRPRRWGALVTLVCAVLGTCAIARAQSAVDGFNPGADNYVFAVAVQPDGKVLVGGIFTMLGGGGTGTTVRNYLGRLNADGSLDADFNPGANNRVNALAVQPDGKILVGGRFTTLGGGGTGTTARTYLGRLNANGSLDTSFDPGANEEVTAIAIQPDGKILVGGGFTALGGGGTGTTTRYRIGRLHADGSLDTSFNPGANWNVFALAVQPDGQILVGGGFSGLGAGTGATPRHNIGRLHADGTVDAGFDPGADDIVYTLAVQADGRILAGGDFTTLGGGGTGTIARNRIGRLLVDGSLDTSFDPGANATVYALAVQPDGRILVGGTFTTLGGGGTGTATRRCIGRLRTDGALDTSFDPGAGSAVYALVVQPDGKLLVGGGFATLGGGGVGTTLRNYLGRLYADGSPDADFNPGANLSVYTLAVQPDDKVLVGGTFTMLGGGGTGTTTHNRIGRLNADGSLDASFDSSANGYVGSLAILPDGKILIAGGFNQLCWHGSTYCRTSDHLGRVLESGWLDASFDSGALSPIHAVAVQPDGKILVGGAFTMLHGKTLWTTRNRIGRFAADGTLETAFNPGANGDVVALAVQPDGKILVGGTFTTLGGGGTGTTTRNRIGRLNADGSLDTSFDPGANDAVLAFALQPDGKILVGGNFTMLGGGGTGTTARAVIGRLNANGSLDTSFNPGANNSVGELAMQPDGKILVGGAFTMLGGGGSGTTARNRIGRLHIDGSLDTSFDAGADNIVRALAVQPDGKILAGGDFTLLGGGGTGTAPRNFLGRLTNTGAATQDLYPTTGGGVVTWMRGGAGPEVWRVTFESSTDGQAYTSLGSGTRAAGGWELSGLSLPTLQNLFIRARGYYTTGMYNGSGSIVESLRNVWIEPGRTGEFSGDLKSDVLWHHATRGEVWVWPMNGPARTAETYIRTVADTGWEIRGLGDQTGDGQADILWRHETTGQIYFWPMNGSTPLAETYVATVDPAYDIVGVGDYNGDNKSDILWRHLANGEVWIWLMDGATPLSQVYVDTVDPAYAVVGSGDLDGDHKADIVWRHSTYGQVWVWLMNGTVRTSQTHVGTVGDVGYQIVGVADCTGDGKADILWHHATRGEVWIWPMDGTTVVSESYVDTVPDTGYQIVGSGDYNGDRKADILWRHATRGEVWVWLMDGTTRLSQTWVGTVPDTGYRVIK